MELIGTWFNNQGYTLFIESLDDHTISGDFGFDTGQGQRRIPIEGVITPNGKHTFSLLFSIHWNQYMASIDGYTHFYIQLTRESKGIAFDAHWIRHPDQSERKTLKKGILHFSKFDLKELSLN